MRPMRPISDTATVQSGRGLRSFAIPAAFAEDRGRRFEVGPELPDFVERLAAFGIAGQPTAKGTAVRVGGVRPLEPHKPRRRLARALLGFLVVGRFRNHGRKIRSLSVIDPTVRERFYSRNPSSLIMFFLPDTAESQGA